MGVFRFGIMGAAKIGAKFCDAVGRLPQAQVAAVMGISQVQVCRIEKKTLKAMARGMSQE